jgi:hypothetical protein
VFCPEAAFGAEVGFIREFFAAVCAKNHELRLRQKLRRTI